MKEKVIELIQQAAEETNDQLAMQMQHSGKETALYGEGSSLDSIGLVNFIVTVEAAVEDELGVNLVLANERAMSQKNSPFRTVETLTNYVCVLIDEERNGSN